MPVTRLKAWARQPSSSRTRSQTNSSAVHRQLGPKSRTRVQRKKNLRPLHSPSSPSVPVDGSPSEVLPPTTESEAVISLLALASSPSPAATTETMNGRNLSDSAAVGTESSPPLSNFAQRPTTDRIRKKQNGTIISGTNGQGVQMVLQLGPSRREPTSRRKATPASAATITVPQLAEESASHFDDGNTPQPVNGALPSDIPIDSDVTLLQSNKRMKHTMSSEDLFMYMAWDFIDSTKDGEDATSSSNTTPEHENTHQQELAAARSSILATTLKITDATKTTYMSYLSIFKQFCDLKYSHEEQRRYEVDDDKTTRFFAHCMLRRTKVKHFYPKKYYANEPLYLNESVMPDGTPLLSEQTVSSGSSQKNTRTIRTVDLAALLRDVREDKLGRKALDVPCGKTTMEQALKAVIKLYDLQRQRRNNPNTVKLGVVDKIRGMIDQYHQQLVTGSFLDSSNALLNSVFALSYDTKQHIQLLLDAWENIEDTSLLLTMRNHLGLAIRHSMMLRDEDLRNALMGNFLMPTVPNKPGGAQIVHALTFTMNQGNSNKDGNVQYGVALRHVDVRRCSIGSLAFYLYERWRYPEDVPNFMDPTFHKFVLVHSGPDIAQPILYREHHDIVKKAYLRQGLNLSNVMHGGRHSGALEAQKVGVSADNIQVAGRWSTGTGSMHQRYLDNYPIDAAYALAGFMDHPLHLRRCEAHPSNELQMQVFPFIESALFSEGSVERREWVRKCKEAMEETVSGTKVPYHSVNIQPLRDLNADARGEDSMNRFTQQQHFLLMLVRMRRVILQDAAEYLCRFDDLSHPPLQKDVFYSLEFKEFQEDVRECLNRPEPVEIQQWPAESIRAFKHTEDSMYSLRRAVQQCRIEHNAALSSIRQELLSIRQELSSIQQEQQDFMRETRQHWEQEADQNQRRDEELRKIVEQGFMQNQQSITATMARLNQSMAIMKRTMAMILLSQDYPGELTPHLYPHHSAHGTPANAHQTPLPSDVSSLRRRLAAALSTPEPSLPSRLSTTANDPNTLPLSQPSRVSDRYTQSDIRSDTIRNYRIRWHSIIRSENNRLDNWMSCRLYDPMSIRSDLYTIRLEAPFYTIRLRSTAVI